MKLEIVEEGIKDIPVKELQSNQIAIITKWSLSPYEGLIVVLVKDPTNYGFTLSVIGDTNKYWSNWNELDDNCRVRVLSPGTILKIV